MMKDQLRDLQSFYQDKKVLVTGCTGFKGAWLSIWLSQLGAEVIGLADTIPTEPSIFQEGKLNTLVNWHRVDIRNIDSVCEIVATEKPAVIFNLAAQALVRKSFQDPVSTFSTNAMGTLSILEAAKLVDNPCRVICITSDKVYDNVEWAWGYRESDRMGGPDPYSGSKAAAEMIIRSYIASYFSSPTSKVLVGIGRAGNVIGGGDWAQDRIIPDIVRAWSKGETVKIRNPNATRPWQHVLEPLGGYLMLGVKLDQEGIRGEAFNFGPMHDRVVPVGEILTEMKKHWSSGKWEIVSEDQSRNHESMLLKLNCDKALHYLKWHSILPIDDAIKFTAEWYGSFYENKGSIVDLCLSQIKSYLSYADRY